MLANWSTGRRGRFAAGFVALVGSISLSVVSRGCSSEALRLWAADEIVLAGAGNVEDGHRNFSVLLSIKNIDGMPNPLMSRPIHRVPRGLDAPAGMTFPRW